MHTPLSRTMRLSLAAAAAAFLAGCGGDANEQGAATSDSAGQATVGAAPGDVATASVPPQEAIAFMAAADQSEIQAAQVAVTKATDREVRQFAQKMRTEHSKSSQDISALARQMNVSLDTSAQAQQGQMVASLHQMSQQMSQQLNSTPKGPQFDRAYIDGQVQAHQAVLENLQRIAGTSGTAAGATGAAHDTTGVASPQQAAQKMIPHVQQHLDEARRIQTKLQGAGR